MPERYTKDPDAVLDYTVDWQAEPPNGPWLPQGDTIENSVWIVPDGIAKVSESKDTTTATVWLSGGEDGHDYAVTNRITTVAGRSDDRTIYILVRER